MCFAAVSAADLSYSDKPSQGSPKRVVSYMHVQKYTDVFRPWPLVYKRIAIFIILQLFSQLLTMNRAQKEKKTQRRTAGRRRRHR